MSTSSTRGAAAPAASKPRRKPARAPRLRDPRARMAAAMLALVGEQGYCDTTVAHVIARAEASRKTFYQQFGDIRDCFLAVADEVAEAWIVRIRDAWADAERPGDALEALVGELLAAAQESPAALRLLTAELPAAGADGLERRERTMAELGRMIDTTLIELARADPGVNGRARLREGSLLGRVLAGALMRIPYARVRQGARVRRPRGAPLAALQSDVARWLACYRRGAPQPAGRRGGREGAAAPPGGRAPGTLALDWRASERRGLPRGEGSVSRSFVVHSQRERLLDALANLSAAKGYPKVTIPEIVHEAAVSVQAFYEHFVGREDAFLVAQEVGQRKALAIAEQAYANHADWASGMRAAVGALLAFMASEPAFAHLAFVDALYTGAKATELSRNVDGACAQLIGLGAAAAGNGGQHPQIMAEGSARALVELCHVYAAAGRAGELTEATELAAHIALDPFLGARARSGRPRVRRAKTPA